MYLILFILFIIVVLLLCRGVQFCCDANSESQQLQLPTVAAAAATTSTSASSRPSASTNSGTTNADPRPSMTTMNKHVKQRTAMGVILIDDNDNGTDEDEIDLNASSADAKTSKILSADFGDNNVHPIEETSCSICLINYQHGDRIQRNAFDGYDESDSSGTSRNNKDSDVKKRCDHVFHPECISSWIKTNTGDGECPICRRPFILISPV